MLLIIIFVAVCAISYYLAFPSRAGDTSRVSLVDRIVLGIRLGISRVLIVVRPFASRTAEDLSRFGDKKKEKDNDKSPLLSKLMTAEDAVRAFVVPHSVLYFSGFAASESPAVWSHALKQVANKTASSSSSSSSSSSRVVSQLTIITQTGSSLRGVGSDSIDNVITDTPAGTVKRLIAGHLETCVGTLRKVDAEGDSSNKIELYNIPLGVISRLVGLQTEMSTVAAALQRNGAEALSDMLHPRRLDTTVGVGSYLETSRGQLTKERCKLELIAPRMHQRDSNEVTSLVYGMPPVTVAMIHARFADEHGNVHFEESTLVGDAMTAARAARQNGGRVLVSVQEIRNLGEEQSTSSSSFILPADQVDAIAHVSSVLLHDFSGLARHCRPPLSSNKKKEEIDRQQILELWERAALGYSYATTFHSRWRDSNRDSAVVMHAHDEVMRLARLLTQWKRLPVIRIMIGVSLPELVAMRIAESGFASLGVDVTDKELARTPFALRDEAEVERRKLVGQEGAPCIQFVVESGVVGGLPSPGFLFGTALHPHRVLEGPAFWGGLANSSFVHMCVLGAGEVDVSGAVNVSRGGDRLRDVIGCGGFPDIVDGVSYAIVVVVSMSSGGTRFQRPHGSSIVQKVREATFSPLAALRNNVSVRYCTEFGVFHADLCEDGVSTRLVAPPGLEVLVQNRCKVQLKFECDDK